MVDNFYDCNDVMFYCYINALFCMFEFHKGQVDKCGMPYFLHPMRVAGHFQKEGDALAAVVSLLHDVVEDTDCTLAYLEDRYPSYIVDAVDAITRRENETYKQYIRRCIENDVARRVKKQDILDNLKDDRMFDGAPLDRYYKALCWIREYELTHR